jgi:hypothetical protein
MLTFPGRRRIRIDWHGCCLLTRRLNKYGGELASAFRQGEQAMQRLLHFARGRIIGYAGFRIWEAAKTP